MAEKYGKSISQLCLRWHIQKRFYSLPKSVTPERIFENTQLFDFSLFGYGITNFITLDRKRLWGCARTGPSGFLDVRHIKELADQRRSPTSSFFLYWARVTLAYFSTEGYNVQGNFPSSGPNAQAVAPLRKSGYPVHRGEECKPQR